MKTRYRQSTVTLSIVVLCLTCTSLFAQRKKQVITATSHQKIVDHLIDVQESAKDIRDYVGTWKAEDLLLMHKKYNVLKTEQRKTIDRYTFIINNRRIARRDNLSMTSRLDSLARANSALVTSFDSLQQVKYGARPNVIDIGKLIELVFKFGQEAWDFVEKISNKKAKRYLESLKGKEIPDWPMTAATEPKRGENPVETDTTSTKSRSKPK